MFCRRRHGNRAGVVGDSTRPGEEEEAEDGGGDAHKIEISPRVKKGGDGEMCSVGQAMRRLTEMIKL